MATGIRERGDKIMTLKTCLDIGRECGLKTVGDAVFNIDMLATHIFEYGAIAEEENEIVRQRDELFANTRFTNDSKIEDVLAWMKG